MTELKIKFLYAVILLLSLAVQGTLGQCTLKDMSIHQTKVNNIMKTIRRPQPLWNVTITNNCYCSQSNVRIACTGDRTLNQATIINPSIAKVAKGKIVINKGQPIYPYTSVGFTYASMLPLQFKLLSSQVACS